MAQFERSEEETIQAIKDWWAENGRAVIAGVVLGIGGIVGVRYWFDAQATSRQEASQLYSQVMMAVQSGNRQQALEQVGTLTDEYGSTVYASLAALGMARLELEAGEADNAERHLRWALENSKTDEYAHLARQRLARLLIAREQPGQAAKLLEGVDEGGYASIYAEIRGDIEVARSQPEAARSHYQTALQQASQPLRLQLLEMKLAELSPDSAGRDPIQNNEVQP
ncbi:tetratricopeptide repeat protein [Thiohalophilus sp.]|uniref:YfgM family protein n=1 Tax=Thiohalophilus sp. TaxID=3028392 RepID=UPI002ACD49D6|nr:tetratricopeptide repeat protein [Thiohalophilus sp.]MDZ7802775.1 tetratricopeptide repeat protein [Thiohalophilus sp.]